MRGKGKMEPSEEKKANKWVFPPQLERTKNDFLSLLDTMTKQNRSIPLMIMGDTGVGKSAFVDLFEDHFKHRKTKQKIRRVNVASLPETLIESELFGHVKGAFTSATHDRKGLVEDTDLLILEEIGELRSYVQAKLLTFIEDGYYYPVGSNKQKENHDIQIVTTTNRTAENLRPDFYHRFFHFEVPPLYRRRTDVLYYFHHFSPMVYQELRPWEIMLLLCHDWPGNVREVETLSMEIAWAKSRQSIESGPALGSYFFEAMTKTTTGLSPESCRLFRNSLKVNGIDVDLLEKTLNQFGLGLNLANRNTPIKDSVLLETRAPLKYNAPTKAPVQPNNTRRKKAVPIEARIGKGLQFFTSLFWKDSNTRKNLLEARSDGNPPSCAPHNLIDDPSKKHFRLVTDCLRWIGIKIPDEIDRTASGINEFLEGFKKTMAVDPISSLAATSSTETPFPERDETEKEAVRRYYCNLLTQEQGNVRKVAKKVGRPYSTVRDKITKLGINITEYRYK
jgi:DNA-binding NtrC family response regulator